MAQHKLKTNLHWGFFLVAIIWLLYCIYTMQIFNVLLFGCSISLLLVTLGMRLWDFYDHTQPKTQVFYLCYSCYDAQVKRKHTLCDACTFMSTLKGDQ
jgi:hypothetical protein